MRFRSKLIETSVSDPLISRVLKSVNDALQEIRDYTRKVVTLKLNGETVATRPSINFVAGTGVTVTVTEDARNDQITVTISAP